MTTKFPLPKMLFEKRKNSFVISAERHRELPVLDFATRPPPLLPALGVPRVIGTCTCSFLVEIAFPGSECSFQQREVLVLRERAKVYNFCDVLLCVSFVLLPGSLLAALVKRASYATDNFFCISIDYFHLNYFNLIDNSSVALYPYGLD